ncbi:hypothetical protein TSAR_010051, partial [Trichomalopsis sarcophagae]
HHDHHHHVTAAAAAHALHNGSAAAHQIHHEPLEKLKRDYTPKIANSCPSEKEIFLKSGNLSSNNTANYSQHYI